jgi:hypothetical protein
VSILVVPDIHDAVRTASGVQRLAATLRRVAGRARWSSCLCLIVPVPAPSSRHTGGPSALAVQAALATLASEWPDHILLVRASSPDWADSLWVQAPSRWGAVALPEHAVFKALDAAAPSPGPCSAVPSWWAGAAALSPKLTARPASPPLLERVVHDLIAWTAGSSRVRIAPLGNDGGGSVAWAAWAPRDVASPGELRAAVRGGMEGLSALNVRGEEEPCGALDVSAIVLSGAHWPR